MGWYFGSIPILVYNPESSVVAHNYLLLTDNTPILLTDNTPMLLAGN